MECVGCDEQPSIGGNHFEVRVWLRLNGASDQVREMMKNQIGQDDDDVMPQCARAEQLLHDSQRVK